jgi:hypothetical protein
MGIIKRTSAEPELLGQTFTPVLFPLNQLSSNLADGCVGVDVDMDVEAKPTLARPLFPPLKLVLVELPLKLPSKNLGNMVDAWWWKKEGAGEGEGFKDIL